MTIAELAREVGLSEATLSRFERGIGRTPGLIRLVGDEPHACKEALAEPLCLWVLGDLEEFCGRRG